MEVAPLARFLQIECLDQYKPVGSKGASLPLVGIANHSHQPHAAALLDAPGPDTLIISGKLEENFCHYAVPSFLNACSGRARERHSPGREQRSPGQSPWQSRDRPERGFHGTWRIAVPSCLQALRMLRVTTPTKHTAVENLRSNREGSFLKGPPVPWKVGVGPYRQRQGATRRQLLLVRR